MKRICSTLFLAALALVGALPASAAPAAPSGSDDRLRRNFEVILDTSGSMNDNGKIGAAKAALTTFLHNLPEDAYVGLICFDSGRPKRLLPLGKLDRSQIDQIVARLRADGATPIRDSLVVAAESLRRQREAQGGYGSYTIVVVTDGEETVNSAALPSTVQAVIAQGNAVDVIGFDLDSEHSLKAQVTTYRSARDQATLTQAIMGTLAEVEDYKEVAQFVKEEQEAVRTGAGTTAHVPTPGPARSPSPLVIPSQGTGFACCYVIAILLGGVFVVLGLRRPARVERRGR